MSSRKNVHNARINSQLRKIHRALVDVISVMNQPERDDVIIKRAGIKLERPLFPLLVGVERYGPIGIVDLAGRAGRDHTTVSRQVSKLDNLGLVERQEDSSDRRVRKVSISEKGKAMTHHIDAAREAIGRAVFESWDTHEIEMLAHLLEKYAEAIQERSAE